MNSLLLANSAIPELGIGDIMMFIVGLGLVCWGADIFVSGASRLAELMKVSPMLVGVTIVAFGSSAPELFVSLQAALDAKSEILVKGSSTMGDSVLANIIGSNICNIALAVGLCAIINPIKMDKKFFSKELIFFVISAVVLYGCVANDAVIDFKEGVILTGLLLTFIVLCIREVRQKPSTKEFIKDKIVPDVDDPRVKGARALVRPLLAIVGGLAALIYGSQFMVDHGRVIGLSMGFSARVIGLVIYAVGTSLPELAITIMAAFKKEDDIAIGGIVGSNIFNVFCVGGIVSLVNPITASPVVIENYLSVMLLMTLLLMAFLRLGRKVSRYEGAILVAGYIVFIYAALFIW